MRQLLQKLMAKFDPGCATISRTVSVAMDRPLSLRERWDVSMHMFVCGFCRHYGNQLLALQKLVSDLAQPEESSGENGPVLSEQARERIRKSFKIFDKQ
jgi:hypothetical protein